MPKVGRPERERFRRSRGGHGRGLGPTSGIRGVFAATDLGPWWQNIVLALWSSITRSGRVVFPTPRAYRALVEFLRDRIEANELRAVVDRTYPLEDISDAYRYVETQQKIGIVVIDVAPGSSKSYAIQPS